MKVWEFLVIVGSFYVPLPFIGWWVWSNYNDQNLLVAVVYTAFIIRVVAIEAGCAYFWGNDT